MESLRREAANRMVERRASRGKLKSRIRNPEYDREHQLQAKISHRNAHTEETQETN
jgi:hypothetical protein